MSLTRPNICPIEGNPDLYGLGIRLGIYFQLTSTSLSSRLLPREILSAWYTNGIFLLAVFAAVSKSTVSGTIQYVEAYVMLQLMFAFCAFPIGCGALFRMGARGAALGFSQKDKEFLKVDLNLSALGSQWHKALGAAVACYNVWFWFRFEPSGDCEAYIFLFARVSASSGAQGFYRAFAVLYLWWRASGYLNSVVHLAYVFRKAKQSFASIWKLYLSASQVPGSDRDEDILELERIGKMRYAKESGLRALSARIFLYWSVLSIMASSLSILWFVLAVELSLSWNSVRGIYDIGSTGQLIPFIIGLLGLLRVLHIIIRSTDDEVSAPSDVWSRLNH